MPVRAFERERERERYLALANADYGLYTMGVVVVREGELCRR